MKNYADMSLDELKQANFMCECGREHSINIENITVEKGAVNRLSDILKGHKDKKILMVSDPNTYEACGKEVFDVLSDYNIISFTFIDKHIDATLHYAGRLLVEVDPSYEFILGVGSGVINDLCRTVAYRIGVPYAIVGTASSMDGYASTISPTFVDGQKTLVKGSIATIIAADLDVLENAPQIMLKAGFGDVLGKAIAHADWDLAEAHMGTHMCRTCKKIVRNAYDKCVDNIDGINSQSPEAVKAVFEALVLSGMAIGLYQDSRPASGSEHMFGHFWDIAAIKGGRSHPLHGISVGTGTHVCALIAKELKDSLPEGVIYPTPEYIKDMLDAVDAPTSPKELGVSEEEFRQSVIHAWENKADRYTILHFMRDLGKSEEIAEKLVGLFY